MLRRLVNLLVASTAFLIVVTVILRCFSDIMPLASTEPQPVWRFEAAFLLTAAQWIGLAVVVSFLRALLRSFASRRAIAEVRNPLRLTQRASRDCWIDRLAMNFPAGFVYDDDLKVLVAGRLFVANALCQSLAVVDCRSAINKRQTGSISGRNTVADIKVVRLH